MISGGYADEFSNSRYVIKIAPEIIAIRLGDKEIAQYRFGQELAKPCLSPVRAPDGKPITRNAPEDHKHHHGIWIGSDLVNKRNFWTEEKADARLRHDRFIQIFDDELYPGFSARTSWEVNSAETMYDERTFRFRALDNGDYFIDVEVTLKTDSAPVTIGKTKEMGFPAVRVADEIRVTAGGTIVNSEGGANERGTMRQRARWLDYWGTRTDGSRVGIAYFPHPANRDYPPYWFVRDWGWFAPNCTLWTKPIAITQDAPFIIRSRILIHQGNAREARVNQRCEEYLAGIARSQ